MDYRVIPMCLKIVEQSAALRRMIWAVIAVAFMFSLSFVADLINALAGLR